VTLKVQDSHVQVACRSMHVQPLTDAFCSPPCRKDDVSGSVGSNSAVGAGNASARDAFVSPPIRKEVLPTPLADRGWEDVQREEPTTRQGVETRRLYKSLTATGQDDIARQLMQEFDETEEGDMCSESLRQYSDFADAPSQRGEVGSEDEHTASPNRNTRNKNRNAGSSTSSWAKRGTDDFRNTILKNRNTAEPVADKISDCRRGCGSHFRVRGVPTKGPPIWEIMRMREDLVSHNSTELKNLLYGFLRYEGVSCDSSRPEVPVAKKDADHKMFTVKTMFFTARMCLNCMAALFLVSSRL